MKRWNDDADTAEDDNLEISQSEIGLRSSADTLRRLVSKGEAAIDEVLKEQQQKVQEQQKRVFEELTEVQQLTDHIYLLQAQQQHQLEEKKRQVRTLRELKVILSRGGDENLVEPAAFDTLVNVGSDVYMKAVGDDIGQIFIKTGFQFYLQMSVDEALTFLPKREKLLEQKYEYWSLRNARIKAQTQMVLHAIAAVMEDPAMQIMP